MRERNSVEFENRYFLRRDPGREMKVKVLDCTLRDGGYVNNWAFKDEYILRILRSLNDSKVDIIELGYLKGHEGIRSNTTLFSDVSQLKDFSKTLKCSQKVVMINLGDYDVKSLSDNDGTIDGIRLAFHRKDLQSALVQARYIKNAGYDVYFQPMISKNYGDIEFLKMIEAVNEIKVKAFYIVDSFGSMSLKDFSHYIDMTSTNLDTVISLGYHSHNNMQLAFCNAIKMCESNLTHDIIVDSSIYGIGRGAGNLNTEMITDFLNKMYSKNYRIVPLLEIIDELLESLMRRKKWGFSPAQYLSASLDCHPNYATYLVEQNSYHIASIVKILQKIPEDKKASFDKKLIENLYKQYVFGIKTPLKGILDFKGREIFLIASGSSTSEYQKVIQMRISEAKNPCVIALNHKPHIRCDYYFFTNQKRYEAFNEEVPKDKIIITNNVKTSNNSLGFVLDFKRYSFIENNEFIANIIGVILNILIEQKVKNVKIAGLDGYKASESNYSYDENDCAIDVETLEQYNKIIQKIIQFAKDKIFIEFLTPSLFEDLL